MNFDKVFATQLRAGDKFQMRGAVVAVLRDAEPYTDPFGRTEGFIKFWCSGDGREGWVSFGPGGYVEAAAP